MRFTEENRARVKRELEKMLVVSLTPIGQTYKYAQDENGRRYVVVGGHSDWHGISRAMIDAEESNRSNTLLVIATRYGGHRDIFVGPLKPLVEQKGNCSINNKDHYVFHLEHTSGHPRIREAPALLLRKLGKAKRKRGQAQIQSAERSAWLRESQRSE